MPKTLERDRIVEHSTVLIVRARGARGAVRSPYNRGSYVRTGFVDDLFCKVATRSFFRHFHLSLSLSFFPSLSLAWSYSPLFRNGSMMRMARKKRTASHRAAQISLHAPFFSKPMAPSMYVFDKPMWWRKTSSVRISFPVHCRTHQIHREKKLFETHRHRSRSYSAIYYVKKCVSSTASW